MEDALISCSNTVTEYERRQKNPRLLPGILFFLTHLA